MIRHEAEIAHARSAISGNHEMIQNKETERKAGRADLMRQGDIVLTREERPRGMVMRQDDPARATGNRRKQNFPNVADHLVDRPGPMGLAVNIAVLSIYIDDVELRQAIEKQLNKVELANRFTRAIAVGNPREFTQGDKEEQEIAESCNRLIKNAIICWNYLYLSQKLKGMDSPDQKDKLLSAISSHSPMSWAHTNLLGEYDFSDEKLKDTAGIRLPKIAT